MHLLGEDYDAVLVLGTHDLPLARALADAEVKRMLGPGFKAEYHERVWYELKMRRGEPTWVYDDVKGQAGVMFHEIAECD